MGPPSSPLRRTEHSPATRCHAAACRCRIARRASPRRTTFRNPAPSPCCGLWLFSNPIIPPDVLRKAMCTHRKGSPGLEGQSSKPQSPKLKVLKVEIQCPKLQGSKPSIQNPRPYRTKARRCLSPLGSRVVIASWSHCLTGSKLWIFAHDLQFERVLNPSRQKDGSRHDIERF